MSKTKISFFVKKSFKNTRTSTLVFKKTENLDKFKANKTINQLDPKIYKENNIKRVINSLNKLDHKKFDEKFFFSICILIEKFKKQMPPGFWNKNGHCGK